MGGRDDMKDCPSRVLERRKAFYVSTCMSIVHVLLLDFCDIRPFAWDVQHPTPNVNVQSQRRGTRSPGSDLRGGLP